MSPAQLARQFGYIRRFYKESPTMPRDYKESHKGYFNIDRADDHGDDIVLVVIWSNFGKDRRYEYGVESQAAKP